MTSNPDWKRVPATVTSTHLVWPAGNGMVRIIFGEEVGKKTVTYHAAMQMTQAQAKALADHLLKAVKAGKSAGRVIH